MCVRERVCVCACVFVRVSVRVSVRVRVRVCVYPSVRTRRRLWSDLDRGDILEVLGGQQLNCLSTGCSSYSHMWPVIRMINRTSCVISMPTYPMFSFQPTTRFYGSQH